MKTFAGIFAAWAVFLLAAAFFGGLMLVSSFWGLFFVLTLLLSVLTYAFLRFSETLDALQKRVEALEERAGAQPQGPQQAPKEE